MIVEIALGIVLACIILRLLPLIIGGAIVLVVLAGVATVVVAAIYNWSTVLFLVAAIVTYGLALGVPYALGSHLTRRYPVLKSAVDGKVPFDNKRAMPQRIAILLTFVLVGVGLGLVILQLSASGFDQLEASIRSRVK